jgi:hypothetical protein
MDSDHDRRRLRERAIALEYWAVSGLVVGGFLYGLWGGIRTLIW